MNDKLTNDHIAARCPHCKQIVYIGQNTPRTMDADGRREIADMVVSGYSIEHLTLEQFKPEPFGHATNCPKLTH